MSWFKKNKIRPLENGSQFDRHVRAGDEANAKRQWVTASEHYEMALELKPKDSAIHIQYGHSLKEQHRLKDAERAYRSAVDADNANADAYLHLGHVSKLQNHMADAIASYKIAARLGSTTSVGEDARRELTELRLKPPSIVAIGISPIVVNDPAYGKLVTALKHHRLNEAYHAIQALPASAPLDIRLIEAQLLHMMGKLDEAIALHETAGLRRLGIQAFAALRGLYDDHHDEEKGITFVTSEITEGLRLGLCFETMSEPVAHLAKAGKIEAAFEALEPLFSTAATSSPHIARTAVDLKRDRGSNHFPKSLALKFHEDFLERAKELEQKGERAQANLLREEAEALRWAESPVQ